MKKNTRLRTVTTTTINITLPIFDYKVWIQVMGSNPISSMLVMGLYTCLINKENKISVVKRNGLVTQVF